MTFDTLTVILRRNERQRIIAVIRQMTPEGMKEGTNILRKLHPATFEEAKTHVIARMGKYAKEIKWEIEAKEWERDN